MNIDQSLHNFKRIPANRISYSLSTQDQLSRAYQSNRATKCVELPLQLFYESAEMINHRFMLFSLNLAFDGTTVGIARSFSSTSR